MATPKKLFSETLLEHEKERARLARVMGSFGQTLCAIKYRIEQSIDYTRNNNTQASVHLMEGTLALILDLVSKSQEVQAELLPSHLETFGLIATIRWFNRTMGIRHPSMQFVACFEAQEQDIHPELKLVIFRMLQDLARDFILQPHARTIKTTLTTKPHCVGLVIEECLSPSEPDAETAIIQVPVEKQLELLAERIKVTHGTFELILPDPSTRLIRAVWPLWPAAPLQDRQAKEEAEPAEC